MVTFTEADNGKTENVTQNTQFAVVLAENPSTGFAWNATLSPGLELQSDTYNADASAGRVGASRNPYLGHGRKGDRRPEILGYLQAFMGAGDR